MATKIYVNGSHVCDAAYSGISVEIDGETVSTGVAGGEVSFTAESGATSFLVTYKSGMITITSEGGS